MRWISVLYFFEWFIIFLLILLVLILILPVNVDITNIGGEFKVKIRIWFLDLERFRKIFSERTKDKKKSSKVADKKGKYKGAMRYFKKLLMNAGKILRLAIKNIRFKRLKLRILIGSGDAAKTAVEYGEISSIFYPLVAIFLDINEPREYNLSVEPDFVGDSIKADVDISLKVRLINFLIILIDVFKIIRSD